MGLFDAVDQYQNDGWKERPVADADGFPAIDTATGELLHEWYLDYVLDETGERIKERVMVPRAVNPLTHSFFDPTGLAPAICKHGLQEHPDPRVQASNHARYATTWIRSKYLNSEPGMVGTCPVCFGQPRPDDLTTPANA